MEGPSRRARRSAAARRPRAAPVADWPPVRPGPHGRGRVAPGPSCSTHPSRGCGHGRLAAVTECWMQNAPPRRCCRRTLPGLVAGAILGHRLAPALRGRRPLALPPLLAVPVRPRLLGRRLLLPGTAFLLRCHH
eukprot:scaffold8611_cov108-Isochrysis_galbana.AAC.13